MGDRQARDVEWKVAAEDGSVPSWERAAIAVLMDIRRELRAMRRRLDCPDFVGIPYRLRDIEKNTRRRRRPTAKRPS